MASIVTWTAGSIAGGDPDFKPDPTLLGGKGAGLARMCAAGYPVPPGFTITTEVCRAYWKKPEKVMTAIRDDLDEARGWLEDVLGYEPLVSVRSGARVSMPGMMDTVLNVGLTSKNMQRWYKLLGDRTYWDCRRRLLTMYGEIVLQVPKDEIEAVIAKTLHAAKVEKIADLPTSRMLGLCTRLDNFYEGWGKAMPNDPVDQMAGAIQAVFDSWHSPRATAYRDAHKLPHDEGTAVNIQAMVFGNAGADCGTGVLFTRDPATGAEGMVGEFLLNAQGEDVVNGSVTPIPFGGHAQDGEAIETYGLDHVPETMVDAFLELMARADALERAEGDMQDIEFTIERGKLWMLQHRKAKRSGTAAFCMAMEKVKQGIWTAAEAAKTLTAEQFASAQRSVVDEARTSQKLGPPVAKGLGASVGAVIGRTAYTLEQITALKAKGDPVIFCAAETTPDDIACMLKADAILTSKGGFTSHAAVVARGLEKACVVGCSDLVMSGALINGHTMPAFWLGGDGSQVVGLPVGTWLTMDSGSGRVWVGPGHVLDAGQEARDFVLALAEASGMTLRSDAPMERGHLVAGPAIACGDFKEWLKTIPATSTATLDLRLPEEWLDPIDQAFLLATDTLDTEQLYVRIVDALCEVKLLGVKLFAPWLSSRPALVKRVEAAKYGLLPVAQTLAQAMAGKGQVILAPAFLEFIGEGEARELVEAMLTERGVLPVGGLDSVTLGEAAASLLG